MYGEIDICNIVVHALRELGNEDVHVYDIKLKHYKRLTNEYDYEYDYYHFIISKIKNGDYIEFDLMYDMTNNYYVFYMSYFTYPGCNISRETCQKCISLLDFAKIKDKKFIVRCVVDEFFDYKYGREN